MRITNQTLYRDARASIQHSSEQLLEAQREVSSGKKISKPSDDPTAMATSIGQRAELATIETYQRAADSGTSRLTVVDTALSDLVDKLTAVQSAGMAGAGAPRTPEQREAAAQTLEGLKQAIFEDLNTSFNGTYVFAGANSTTPPFTQGAGGVVSAYQGSTRQVTLDVDQGRSVTIGIDGSTISQGTAAASIFDDLDTLIAAVRAGNNTVISQKLPDIEAGFRRATAAQTRVGVQLAALESTQSQLVDRHLSAETRVAQNEDVNMAEAISGLTQAENAYNAALGATGKLSRRSLMDYLS